MENELLGELTSLLNDISKIIGDGYEEDIRLWLMGATLRVWSGNKRMSDDYLKILPIFKEQEYTVAKIATVFGCIGDENRGIEIPDFFKKIVLKDKESQRSDSRHITLTIGCFLASLAMVNGDFTMEEARYLNAILTTLLDYCDHQGVVEGETIEYHPERLTPLNESSYYDQEIETKDSKESKDSKGTNKTQVKENQVTEKSNQDLIDTPPITFNLNVITNDQKDSNTIKPNQQILDTDDNQNVNTTTVNPKEDTLESVLEELNSLVGLDKVKEDVRSLLNFIKIRQLRLQRHMPVPTMSYHLVFTGNPGTGKTTVARLVAKIYYLLGVLPQGQLVEVDRSGLVAGYLGQTAIKTQKVIEQALGGVLFIDEAYSLANENKEDSYGKEAIETLLKAMEDHRDEFIVIVAGYDELMKNFINSNPGLRSRFNKYFQFPDYDGDELLLILKRFCETNAYDLNAESLPYIHEQLNGMYQFREEHFGNARTVRNLFEHAISYQANRLVLDTDITDQELKEINLDDIKNALGVMNNG